MIIEFDALVLIFKFSMSAIYFSDLDVILGDILFLYSYFEFIIFLILKGVEIT